MPKLSHGIKSESDSYWTSTSPKANVRSLLRLYKLYCVEGPFIYMEVAKIEEITIKISSKVTKKSIIQWTMNIDPSRSNPKRVRILSTSLLHIFHQSSL